MKSRTLTLTILAVFLMVGSAMALPFNDRDPQINILNAPGSEHDLQEVFDTVITSGDVPDAYGDQEEAALWTQTDGNIDSYVLTMFTAAAGTLGVYSGGTEVDLLYVDDAIGGIGPGSADNTISFDVYNSGVLEFGGNTYAGFDSFGFYWRVGQNTYYTEDDKNTNDTARALAYLVEEGTVVDRNAYGAYGDSIVREVTYSGNDDWLIAFEDGGDWDFNDAVFLIEDMKPVPEPGTIVLLGAGLVGLAAWTRRKKFQK